MTATQLPQSPGQVPPFRMGDWLVLPEQNRVIRQDAASSDVDDPGSDTDTDASASVQLEPRIMHVLVCLAARPGGVVTRNELLDTVWSQVIVREEALTHAVSQLRRTLGDDSRSARAIETIRKGGYRLLLPVAPLATDAAPTPGIEHLDAAPAPLASQRDRLLLAAAAVCVVIVGAVMILRGSDRTDDSAPTALQARPVTCMQGSEIYPALSPDGSLLTFSYAPQGSNDYELYIKRIDGGEARPLTTGPGNEIAATWSPTGDALAFIRTLPGDLGVYTVPAIGGDERPLLTGCSSIIGLSWSPAGNALCLGLLAPDDPQVDQHAIYRLSLDDLSYRPLVTPPALCDDILPAYAPDGESIAFVRMDYAGLVAIHLMTADGGEVRRIGPQELDIQGLTWLPDGRSVIYSCLEEGRCILKRLSPATGRTELFQAERNWVFFPKAAGRAASLVYEERALTEDIYACGIAGSESDQVDATAAGSPAGQPYALLNVTQPDYAPRFSPDGDQIAFLSLRSGRLALWVCDRSGDKARLLAAPPGLTQHPHGWSPDGRTIACTTFNDGFLDICLVDTRSGGLRRLSDRDRHLTFTAWSADGSALYCRTNRNDRLCGARFTLADGHIDDLDPPATRVLRDEPDGYYYWLPGDRRIRFRAHDTSPTVDPDRGDVTLGPLSPGAHIRTMTLRGDHVYFAESDDGRTTFRRLDTATSRIDSLATVSGPVGRHLDVSPDGRTLLFDLVEVQQVDVMLMENIR